MHYHYFTLDQRNHLEQAMSGQLDFVICFRGGRATRASVAMSFVNSGRGFRCLAFASVINASAKFLAAKSCAPRN